MYETIKASVGAQDPAQWGAYDNGHQEWEYLEFGWRGERWARHYRTVYTRAVTRSPMGSACWTVPVPTTSC